MILGRTRSIDSLKLFVRTAAFTGEASSLEKFRRCWNINLHLGDRTTELQFLGNSQESSYVGSCFLTGLLFAERYLALKPDDTLIHAREVVRSLVGLGAFAANNLIDALASLGFFHWSDEFLSVSSHSPLVWEHWCGSNTTEAGQAGMGVFGGWPFWSTALAISPLFILQSPIRVGTSSSARTQLVDLFLQLVASTQISLFAKRHLVKVWTWGLFWIFV